MIGEATIRHGAFAAKVLTLVLLVGVPGRTSPLAAQDTHLIVVAGLGGDRAFQQDFLEWGGQLTDAALAVGVPPDQVTFLAENPEADPERVHGRSTGEEVERAIQSVAERAAPDDRVLIVLIGHGSGTGEDSRVSLPGPSLRAADYGRLLETLSPRPVALVNMASGSGDFIPVVAGENRIIVTATRSSAQRNAAIFGRHFVAAFTGEGADLDRDGTISILEAFEYARLETERHYRDQGLIASEQAMIEDRPAGRGVSHPMDDPDVGARAGRFVLQGPWSRAGPPPDPAASLALEALRHEQAELEGELEQLMSRREAVAQSEYQEALQELLVELARIGQEIRRLESEP